MSPEVPPIAMTKKSCIPQEAHNVSPEMVGKQEGHQRNY
jgi:hypothetical protein